jgi:RNA-directed DNA polymerase
VCSFDEIPHELIFKLIRRPIADERLVTLVARALKAGVIVDGLFEKTTKGTPQGSPLSPILSNIVLNEMDHELERRGLAYARWADDFVILVKTERSAQRVMERIIRYLEESLGLPVNREKSRVAKMSEVTFLGFRIYRDKIRVSPESLEKFKGQVRELTHRNNPLSMYMAVRKLNSYLRGWVEYFRIQEGRRLFRLIDQRIRCRLRVMQLVKWKKPKKLQRIMIKSGFPVWESRRTWVEMDKWRSIYRKKVRMVLCLKWFRQMGLVFLEDFTPAPTRDMEVVNSVVDRRAAYLAGDWGAGDQKRQSVQRGADRATRRLPALLPERALTWWLELRRCLFSRFALCFLLVGITDHLLDGAYVIGPAFLEVLEVQLLDELGQGRLPGLLLGVGQAAELLRIQPQLPGHLDVGIGKMEAPRLNPR